MKVELNGTTFLIGWQHNNKPEADQKETICEIKKILPNGDAEMVNAGVAICSDLDNYDRNKGRKISLQRAMFLLELNDQTEELQTTALFPVEQRQTIWESYNKMRGGRW